MAPCKFQPQNQTSGCSDKMEQNKVVTVVKSSILIKPKERNHGSILHFQPQ